MVCIIDDREDVWSHASNLIHVKPYHFFQHTGDINAPPGLDKHEEDDKSGVDLSHFIKADKDVDSSEVVETDDIKDKEHADQIEKEQKNDDDSKKTEEVMFLLILLRLCK